jgi:hypothetical protein
MAGLNGIIALTLRFGFRELRTSAGPIHDSEGSVSRAGDDRAVAPSGPSAILSTSDGEAGGKFPGSYRETFALVLTVVLFGLPPDRPDRRTGLSFRRGRDHEPRRIRPGCWEDSISSPNLCRTLSHGGGAHPDDDAAQGRSGGRLMFVPATGFGANGAGFAGRTGTGRARLRRLLGISSLPMHGDFFSSAFVLHGHLDYGAIVLVIAGLSALA